MEKNDPLKGQIANLDFLEALYRHYQSNPDELDPSWKPFFQEMERGKQPQATLSIPPSFRGERIFQLSEAYRKHGHRLAAVNPLALDQSNGETVLQLESMGFNQAELEELFPSLGLIPQEEAPLRVIVEKLKKLYCGSIGFEFKDFTPPELEEWIQQEIEGGRFEASFGRDEKKMIFTLLTNAEVLETFLHTKHVGKKRFSLEGAESLIPMLQLLAAKAADEGVEEIVIGMSHRGRLNVLANLLMKPIFMILKDFDDEYEPTACEGTGDIRYHKGHANEAVETCRGKKIRMSVAPNPSHLESVDPVVEGQVHAKQFLQGDEEERRRIIPLVMHGDAALSGQGVVYETLQMSKLQGFETGGTIHIAINNQIGFTTSPNEGRSTLYCTDIAHAFGIPVMHVNAEDPEACIRAALFALDLRTRFHCSVFIDFNCYRKYGHNEGDEPAFTQPLEYKLIRSKPSIRKLYLERLIEDRQLEQNTAEEIEDGIRQQLLEAYTSFQKNDAAKKQPDHEDGSSDEPSIETAVPHQLLMEAAEKLPAIPPDMHLHPKIEHLMKERARAVKEDAVFDWGTAEYLAYGTLCLEGVPVRLVGQDSGRGTFSHRHAVWIDQEDSHPYIPLAHLSPDQGRFEVLNTCLSEVAALGFEYGYSTVLTNGLTIWEAQFGDFVNSAQVIIDQYIASGEQKWGQISGLVLFLPHGFEGQGPEHSSARFERFLSLAGHDNMQIVNPTLPAQLFHLLRRQVKQPHVKPLIVMTPKGLLRHPACVSRASDLVNGHFHKILDDPRKPLQATRLLLCSGRIYYDLENYRLKNKREDLAIVRLEQLYPFDEEQLRKVVEKYSQIKECFWVQEEPCNMGAWTFIFPYLSKAFASRFSIQYAGRESSASPATGFYARHKQELDKILHQVFEA